MDDYSEWEFMRQDNNTYLVAISKVESLDIVPKTSYYKGNDVEYWSAITNKPRKNSEALKHILDLLTQPPFEVSVDDNGKDIEPVKLPVHENYYSGEPE